MFRTKKIYKGIKKKILRIIGGSIGFLVAGLVLDYVLPPEESSALSSVIGILLIIGIFLFIIAAAGVYGVYNEQGTNPAKGLAHVFAFLGVFSSILSFILLPFFSFKMFLISIAIGGTISFLIWYGIGRIAGIYKYTPYKNIFKIFTCCVGGVFVKTFLHYLGSVLRIGSIGLIGGSLVGGIFIKKTVNRTYDQILREKNLKSYVILFFTFIGIIYILGVFWVMMAMITYAFAIKLHMATILQDLLIGGGLGISSGGIIEERIPSRR